MNVIIGTMRHVQGYSLRNIHFFPTSLFFGTVECVTPQITQPFYLIKSILLKATLFQYCHQQYQVILVTAAFQIPALGNPLHCHLLVHKQSIQNINVQTLSETSESLLQSSKVQTQKQTQWPSGHDWIHQAWCHSRDWDLAEWQDMHSRSIPPRAWVWCNMQRQRKGRAWRSSHCSLKRPQLEPPPYQ